MKEIFDKLDMEKLWRKRGHIACPFNETYNGSVQIRGCVETNSPCSNLFSELGLDACPCTYNDHIFVANRFWKRVEEWNINRLMGRG